MSLLLEALKKAEKAKEEAQRRSKTSASGTVPESVFDPEATVLDDGRHVTRRDELPDISAPLEILSDDLRPAAPAKAPLELALSEDPPAAREAKSAPRREAARAAANQNTAANAERVTAQRVFEAKFKEPNPRLPFYITSAVLGLFAVGTVAYFWIQLRPPPSLVNANPPRAADERPVETAAQKPAALPGLPGSPAAPAAIPGLPNATPTPATPAPAPAAAPAAIASQATTAPAATPAATATPAAATAAKPAAPAMAQRDRTLPPPRSEGRPVTVNRNGPQIHPLVASGYVAYQAGDLTKARSEYQQVLREDASNRDALLGLAAVEMRAQRYDLADSYYQRLLQADPRDAYAQAGMVALRGQQLDPVQVESRVKSLITTDRNSNVLHFTLGNQYAQQGRWAEAQQAYFKAFATDPDNPDFAFNLAISLDQLHQQTLALEYYRKALVLAEKRSASFAPETARTRVQQLSR